MTPKFKVGILGATGAVGQKFVQILGNHPWFEVSVLAASERSAGKPYGEATNWIGSREIPAHLVNEKVQLAKPGIDCDFVFSGLDSSVAGDLEKEFAAAGYPVISNAKNYRMHENVPLLIPEVNPEHTALIKNQQWGGAGFIVTNPHCATVGLVCALKPLYDAYGVDAVQVTTMQALSGAGYPGVSALDILGNVIPYIGGEEDKLVTEPLKLLGSLGPNGLKHADFAVSAQCNRVPVLDGHTETVSLRLRNPGTVEEVRELIDTFKSPLTGLGLPSAPDKFLHRFEDNRFPQPRRHANLGNGMTVSIGRIRPCEVLDVKFVVLSHNTIRGAAGGAVLNAELLVHQGYLKTKKSRESVTA